MKINAKRPTTDYQQCSTEGEGCPEGHLCEVIPWMSSLSKGITTAPQPHLATAHPHRRYFVFKRLVV
jgi:hypothetical protein